MIELTDIAYVRSGAADLDSAARFTVDVVGLGPVGDVDADGTAATAEHPDVNADQRVAYLRADGRHHRLALVEGGSGVLASGFTARDEEALALAGTELETRGVTAHRGDPAAARSRRVAGFLAFDDPFGNRIELVVGQ
ncbi:VOC family protein [Pseudonocardia thermophila]|jgi:Glyoxalase/Bleomycin resistance protein/Dioxygenase superfamily.|uniref:VOC family protein n=1 Tax=Pseudonocardia thermophila TaxID=1848 RepID=UPI00248EB1F6|nr:VOC family protein [Pseudonocardia thermophila]